MIITNWFITGAAATSGDKLYEARPTETEGSLRDTWGAIKHNMENVDEIMIMKSLQVFLLLCWFRN